MPRTKQKVRTRAKPHRDETYKLRKRKNRLKANQRKARSRPRRRQGKATKTKR